MNEIVAALGLASPAAAALAMEWRARTSPRLAPEDNPSLGLSERLLYRSQPRKDVLKLKNGSFLAAWSFGARDAASLDDVGLSATAERLAGEFGLLPPGIIVQVYARRFRVHEYDQGLGRDHPVLHTLDRLRLRRSILSPMYRTVRHFVLTSKPKNTVSKLADENRELDDFERMCAGFESALGGVLVLRRLSESWAKGPRGVEVRQSDLLGFVSSKIDGLEKPLNVAPPHMDLSSYLADREYLGGLEPMIGDQHLGFLDLNAFPDGTEPLVLNGLSEIGVSHDLVVRFIPMTLAAARKELKDAGLEFKGDSAFHLGFVDPGAERDSDEAFEAYGAARQENMRFGRTSTVVVLRSEKRADLQRAKDAVMGVLEGAGFRAIDVRMGATETFFSSLPGNGVDGLRKHPQPALLVSHLFPLHERDEGERWNTSQVLRELVPAVFDAPGPGESFTRIHLNVKDVPHGYVIGPTTSGKSVFVAFAALMLRARLTGVGVTFFDRGQSSRRVVEMMDGSVWGLGGANSPGFALFPNVEDDDERGWVLGFLSEILELWDVTVSGDRHRRLEEAVDEMRSLDRADRNMQAFIEQLQDDEKHEMAPVFNRYAGKKGEIGDALDRSEDSFSSGRFDLVDWGKVIGKGPRWLIPLLRVVIHKCLEDVKKRTSNLHVFVIDEAHWFLEHPVGQRFVKDLLKMGRSQRIGVWLVTNGLRDLTDSPILSDILQACSWRAYMQNDGATGDEASSQLRRLGLPEAGPQMISDLPLHGVLIHRPEAVSGQIQEVDPRIDREVLALVGTSHGTQATLDAKRDWGADWKARLLESEGAHEAARLLREETL